MSRDFVTTTAEAAVGGFQGIKKVRGLLISIEKVPPRFTSSDYGVPKEQMEIKLEDAAILEMFPNADDFELKDAKFTCWVPYAEPGKTPGVGTYWITIFCASSEEIGAKTVLDNIGKYVTLERQDRVLYKPKAKKGETEPIVVRSVNKAGLPSANSWCFVSDETADSGDVKDYVRGLIVGKNEKSALRALITDPRSKGFPEFKEALKAGEIGTLLEVELVDGIFVAVKDEKDI